MQKSIIALSLLTLLASCGGTKNKDGFQLKGTLTNSNGEMLYLDKLVANGPVAVDSVTLNEKGEFEFANYTPKIGFYRLRLTQQNFAMLVLDSTDKVSFTADIKDITSTYKAEGSPETKLFLEFADLAKKRELRLDSLNKAFMALIEPIKMDTAKVEAISKTFEVPYNNIVNPLNEAMIEKIKQNTTMYSCIMAIQSLEPDKYPDLFKALDAGLSKKFPNDNNIKMFHDMVQRLSSTEMGQLSPDIVLPSPDGTEIALSSLRGKVVLVDFWASWCGPCRKEMPNVVKAYAKFKSKGFEIYGVSLDQDKDRWVEAIAKDGITWPQVSELKQWESQVVKQFNIQGIPYTLLLDREGKILAKNLRGQELEAKLAEVLN
jgi:thiol-disulfide isomerase/thioredoxin